MVAILGALAMAFALALGVYTSSAKAQVTKIAVCHGVPVSENQPLDHYEFIVVDDNSTQLEAHEAHPKDVILGPADDLTIEDCPTVTPPPTTTTTTGTPPPSTTSNVNTTANTTSISVTTSGNCVQTAIQQQIGNTNVAAGDVVNIQNISQECNITIGQAKKAAKTFGVSKFGKVVKPAKVVTTQYVSSASASAKTVTASAKTVTATVSASAAPSVQYVTKSAAPAVQYQYSAPVALPETGGSSLLVPVGALLLLAGGGLLAFFVVRRGFTG